MKLFILTVITLFYANLAYCCTCTIYSFESQFDSVESVVTVKVVELLKENATYEIEKYFPEKRSYRAKVKIIRSFKGVPQPEEIIVLDSHYTNCDPEFAIGEDYLLFLDSNGGMYINRACTNWGLASESKKYIRGIDRLIKKRQTNTIPILHKNNH